MSGPGPHALLALPSTDAPIGGPGSRIYPTAEWTRRQLIEACGPEDSPRYLIRDRDQIYGERFSRQARMLDIRETVIAPLSPWQNAYAERVIGSIRRECLDHIVVIGERHLRGILSNYVDYYNETRTHLALAKDAPEPRRAQGPSSAFCPPGTKEPSGELCENRGCRESGLKASWQPGRPHR